MKLKELLRVVGLGLAVSLGLTVVSCSVDENYKPDLPPVNSKEGSAISFIVEAQLDGEVVNEVGESGGFGSDMEEPLEAIDAENEVGPVYTALDVDAMTAEFDEMWAMANAAGAGIPDKLENLANAQIQSFNFELRTNEWDAPENGPQRDWKTNVVVNYKVYAAYSFDTKKDYYVITQEIIIPNSNLWSDNLVKWWNGAWQYYGKRYWMERLNTNNTICALKNVGANNPLGVDKLIITDYSPGTANGITTHTTSNNGRISGRVGFNNNRDGSGMSVSNGVTFGSSTSWATQDIQTLAKVNTAHNTYNAGWEWVTQKKPATTGSGNGKTISRPAELAVTTAKMVTTWVWIVDNPWKDDKFVLEFDLGGRHGFSHYQLAGSLYHYYNSWNFKNSFILNPPYRGEY
jgi:hypothetical protein